MLFIFLIDARSVIDNLDELLARSGKVSKVNINFSVVFWKLQRIVDHVADDLLETQLVLNQFLRDFVENVTLKIDFFQVGRHLVPADEIVKCITHVEARHLHFKLLSNGI